ncbi:peptidylprolyl isomerase [candidate division KSB1 bacterium]|nr:peptidylprolyl isomerase [candidate division KSB1 bacterium]
MFVLIITLSIITCSKKQQPELTGEVLAKIGDRTITTDEFIRRAEYTIRPPYCNRDDYIERKIVLNSIIAEKLMALEATDSADELTQNEQYQNYITGRKEQAMRQMLYQKLAVEKVKLDTSEIKQAFKLAGRTYELKFCNLKDRGITEKLKTDVLQAGSNLTDMCQQHLGIDELPTRGVGWDSKHEEAIQEALFIAPLKVGQLVGPVETEDGHFLLMEVSGWTDRPVITETAVQRRWNDVKESLTAKHAGQIFREYAAGVMRGKRVEFNRDIFLKLAEMFAPIYIKTPEDKKESLNNLFWKNETTPTPPAENIDQIIDQPLLHIDGYIWTVRDLESELERRPLVFRERRISKQDFPEQFKLAIVDLIRDKYITQDAYKKGYDQLPVVQHNVAMWQDNMLASFQRTKYLNARGIVETSNDYINVIENVLNPYIDSLQTKYADTIEIDTDAFEKIKLTHIDMFVLQKNVPFEVIVPLFPLLTTDNRLDYGRKMN